MDCKTAREYINIFDSLTQQDKDIVLEHAQNCDRCRQELINSAKLLEELSSFDELEAPEGLAQSAINKAKKKRTLPYAYVSVAVAAAIAVAFFATSSILSPRDKAAESDMPMAAAKQESIRATDESFGAGAENEAMMAEMADESADTLEMAMDDYAPEEYDTAEEGAAEDAAEMCYIYVPADKKEFAHAVDTFLNDRGIYSDRFRAADEKEILQFVVGEIYFEEFEQLVQDYGIEYEGTLLPRTFIEMTIEK